MGTNWNHTENVHFTKECDVQNLRGVRRDVDEKERASGGQQNSSAAMEDGSGDYHMTSAHIHCPVTGWGRPLSEGIVPIVKVTITRSCQYPNTVRISSNYIYI